MVTQRAQLDQIRLPAYLEAKLGRTGAIEAGGRRAKVGPLMIKVSRTIWEQVNGFNRESFGARSFSLGRVDDKLASEAALNAL